MAKINRAAPEAPESETLTFSTNAELAKAIDRHCAELDHHRIMTEIELEAVRDDLAEAARAHEVMKHLL